MRNFKFLMLVPMLSLAFGGFANEPTATGHEKAAEAAHKAPDEKEVAKDKGHHKKKPKAPEKKK